jgi:hypothetical protein
VEAGAAECVLDDIQAAPMEPLDQDERLEGKQEVAALWNTLPCPSEERWFSVKVSRFKTDGPVRVVVAHENITERAGASTGSNIWPPCRPST